MPKLFLRLATEAEVTDNGVDLVVEWLVREDDGSVRGDGTTDARGLGEIVDVDAGWVQDPQNIVVLVPIGNVLSIACSVPGRSTSQIRRALPFAVEEYLTEDVEALHLAHSHIQRGEPTRCLLVQRLALEAWLEALSEAGIQPGTLIPDASLLPVEPGLASVLFDGASALIRTPDQMASLEIPLLIEVLGTIAETLGDEPRLQLINGSLSDIDQSQTGFAGHRVERQALDDSVLAYLADRWQESAPEINLLQGEFAPPKRTSRNATRWKSVGMLAAIWLGIGLVVLVAEGFWADYRATAVQAESFSLYKEIYPNEQRVRDPYRQMRAHLGQASSSTGPGFHMLVGQLAYGMDQAVPGTRLRSLSYSDTRTELSAEVWLPSYDGLDSLKDQLTGQGVAVDITSAEQQDDMVRARLRIRASG